MTDYQPLLARALKGLERNTSEARRAVYDRARQALLNQLRSANPPMADADITRERLALEDAIRKTETAAVLAEPHAVRAPSAARVPSPLRPPAAPSASPTGAPPPRMPTAALPLRGPATPPQPRIPMPPAASTPMSKPTARPSAGGLPEPPARPVGEMPTRPISPPRASAPGMPPQAPRQPLPSGMPARARTAGNGARPERIPAPEAPAEMRGGGLPPPELLEELKADLESPSPLPPPQQRFERPRPQGRGPVPGRVPGQPAPVPGEDFPPAPPPPPPGARPRPRRPGPGMPPPVARVKPANSNRLKIILAGVAILVIAAAGFSVLALRGRGPAPAQAPVADGDQPKSSERVTQSPEAQSRSSAPNNLDPAVAQRAVLYEENPGGGQQFQNFVGTAVWKTEAVNAPGRAPDLGLRIEIEIPDRKVGVTLKMRRNTDPSFPASHTIEVIFDVPAGDAFGGVADMRGIRAKGGETAQGNPIAAEVQKVKEGYFLMALPQIEQDANLSLLRDRDWLDIPFVYANGRRAVLTFQKGTPGERALREVLNSWGQGQNQTGGSQ
jgi:hypothetical protein